jgi:uncharacterized metal-binding protein YceD (DUF177 family)
LKLNIKSVSKVSTLFSVEIDKEDAKVIFNGSYKKDGQNVIVEGRLAGSVQVVCDVSCQPFFEQMDEELSVKFVEGEFKGFDPKYDVIETDGEIDLDRFMLEEIESFRLDYHVAPGIQFSEANL